MAYKKSQIPPFDRKLKAAATTIQATLYRRVARFAEMEKDKFRQRILTQDFLSFSLSPLKANTLSRKKRKGLDERVMIATSTYVNSINVYTRVLSRRSRSWNIGFHPRKRARDENFKITDILLSDLAMIQEKGSNKAAIPARPHWGPNLKDMKERAKQLRSYMKDDILRTLKQTLFES